MLKNGSPHGWRAVFVGGAVQGKERGEEGSRQKKRVAKAVEG